MEWNSFRGNDATKLCSAIKYADSLRELNLSYNVIGNDGTIALAEALFDQKVREVTILFFSLNEVFVVIAQCCLQKINLSSNSIGPEATFILGAAIRQSACVNYICLDQNPIGELGGRMLMSFCANNSHYIEFSAKACSINQASASGAQKLFNPTGKHKCKSLLSWGIMQL